MRKNQKHTKKKMFTLILEWENSGLTQEVFFKRLDIPKSTFGYWRKKYLRETGRSKGKNNFIPVKVGSTTDSTSEVLQVVYPNGVRLVCSSGMDLSRLKPLIVL
jgi:transposase-like protein